jgi:hypothetical protein
MKNPEGAQSFIEDILNREKYASSVLSNDKFMGNYYSISSNTKHKQEEEKPHMENFDRG